jgi:hypothetical protein
VLSQPESATSSVLILCHKGLPLFRFANYPQESSCVSLGIDASLIIQQWSGF